MDGEHESYKNDSCRPRARRDGVWRRRRKRSLAGAARLDSGHCAWHAAPGRRLLHRYRLGRRLARHRRQQILPWHQYSVGCLVDARTLPGGGHVEFLGALPEISGGVPTLGTSWSGRDYTELYNPVAYIGAAWDLGNGFGFSAFIGGWAPVENQLRLFGFDSWVLSERVNLSYVANGWKLAANLGFGQPGNTGAATVFVPTGPNALSQILPDYFNYDLTATKTIGKWEVGLVAFGSTDTSKAPWNSLSFEQGAVPVRSGRPRRLQLPRDYTAALRDDRRLQQQLLQSHGRLQVL